MIVLKLPRNKRIRAFAFMFLFLLALVLRAAGPQTWLAVSSTLKPLDRVRTTERQVAITIDITWGESVPAKVLEALKDTGIDATLFFSGPWCETYPEMLATAAKEGYEIGNLGYRYVQMTRLDQSEIASEIASTHEIISQITGTAPKLFRPPAGAYNDAVISAALDNGYVTVTYSLDASRWLRYGAEGMAKQIAKRVRPGDIIVFAGSDGCPETPDAIRHLVALLRNKGFEPVAVGDLLKLNTD